MYQETGFDRWKWERKTDGRNEGNVNSYFFQRSIKNGHLVGEIRKIEIGRFNDVLL